MVKCEMCRYDKVEAETERELMGRTVNVCRYHADKIDSLPLQRRDKDAN